MTQKAYPIHQYIDRKSGEVRTEKLVADALVRRLYSSVRERAPALFRAAVSRRASSLLGALNYDAPLSLRLSSPSRMMRALGIDLRELRDAPETLDTARKIFERKIRFEKFRPLPEDPRAVVAPSDARVAVGSLSETSVFFIKEKFFSFPELLGENFPHTKRFADGDFAVFRLTPDKYHYNHVPATGVVRAVYELGGAFHACNPAAVCEVLTPNSKNRRVVTLLDTDVPGGSGVGLVAMAEVAALMIGEIVQCYSESGYDAPRALRPGMLLRRGNVKSLFRQGSSTVILLFEKDRVAFCEDLLRNARDARAISRYSGICGRTCVETDLRAREIIARPRERAASENLC